MLPASAEDFPRYFAQAFAARDAAAMGAILDDEGSGLTLSGQWAEGPAALESAWAAEFAGLLANARLVTGKKQLRMLGPGAAVLNLRYVITGAEQAEGMELPRFGAVLSAVTIARSAGWQAVSLNFSPLSD